MRARQGGAGAGGRAAPAAARCRPSWPGMCSTRTAPAGIDLRLGVRVSAISRSTASGSRGADRSTAARRVELQLVMSIGAARPTPRWPKAGLACDDAQAGGIVGRLPNLRSSDAQPSSRSATAPTSPTARRAPAAARIGAERQRPGKLRRAPRSSARLEFYRALPWFWSGPGFDALTQMAGLLRLEFAGRHAPIAAPAPRHASSRCTARRKRLAWRASTRRLDHGGASCSKRAGSSACRRSPAIRRCRSSSISEAAARA